MTTKQRSALAASFAVVLAVVTGVIAAGANSEDYLLTLAVVAGVLLVPMAVLGWFLAAALGSGSKTGGGGRSQGQARSGQRHNAARRGAVADDLAIKEQASAAAWRDTMVITGVVLVVVAIVGVQWPTSWVLLGVLVVAMLTQSGRQVQAAR